MMRVLVAVLSLAVVAEAAALWRVSSHQSALHQVTDPELCASLRGHLNELARPEGATGSRGDYAMGMFRGVVTPPMLRACGVDFAAIAGDFKRAQDCYIGTGSASCVVDTAAHIATLLK